VLTFFAIHGIGDDMATTRVRPAVEQFEAAAKAAVATVETIDRTPSALRDAILRTAGDANRILFAPPQDLPAELFADFARDPRVLIEPTAEEIVNSPAGVTEAFADVVTSSVECRGMAGSFGYKHDYYELSMAVGADLFAQVRVAEDGGPRVLVASGISCHEQLMAEWGARLCIQLECY
jgi:hypothetical protein